MRRLFVAVAMVAIALTAAPTAAQDKKQPVQAKMLEWEWVGDTVDRGATYRKFRAVTDGTIDTTKTQEICRGFNDQVSRHEKYEMLSIAQGGTPVMGPWKKEKNGTYTREYSLKTGGRKVTEPVATGRTTSPGGGASDATEPALGKGQLKKVVRGTETEVESITVPMVSGKTTYPGVQTTYTLTYTSPPSDAQVKVDAGWLAKDELIYKYAPWGEMRKSPWRGFHEITWKTTSPDKCTVEAVTTVLRIKESTP